MEDPKVEAGNRERASDSTPISQISPIQEGGLPMVSRAQLAELVEAPVLEACEALRDKGVRTIYSSANRNDVGSEAKEAYIGVDYESLSAENRAIAEGLGTFHPKLAGLPMPHVRIVFPLDASSTVGDVRRASLEVADKFFQQ
jgi:hypothetical protein